MPEGDSYTTARGPNDDEGDSRIWQRLKAIVFGRNHEPTLREQLEEAIAEHEEEAEGVSRRLRLDRVKNDARSRPAS